MEVELARIFDTPLYTSDQSIDRVVNAGLPVALVFLDGASHTALEQAMEQAARQCAGELLVVRVPVKDSPEAVRRYGVGSFPALVLVKNGQVLDRVERLTVSDLESQVKYLLGKGPRPVRAAASEPSPQYAYSGNISGADSSAAANGPTTSTTGGRPVTVTDATFEREVLRSSTPVLVDFWAEWCGPCRMMEPVLNRLAGEMGGRLKIAKVNVDENPRTGGQYGVQAIPTMLLVKDGRIIDRWSGALPESALRSRLANVIR